MNFKRFRGKIPAYSQTALLPLQSDFNLTQNFKRESRGFALKCLTGEELYAIASCSFLFNLRMGDMVFVMRVRE